MQAGRAQKKKPKMDHSSFEGMHETEVMIASTRAHLTYAIFSSYGPIALKARNIEENISIKIDDIREELAGWLKKKKPWLREGRKNDNEGSTEESAHRHSDGSAVQVSGGDAPPHDETKDSGGSLETAGEDVSGGEVRGGAGDG